MELDRKTDSIDMFVGLYMLSKYSSQEAENQNPEQAGDGTPQSEQTW